MYVLIEMADVELLGVRVFTDREPADAMFDGAAKANGAHKWAQRDLAQETYGTVRLAGDDSYSVQLVEATPR